MLRAERDLRAFWGVPAEVNFPCTGARAEIDQSSRRTVDKYNILLYDFLDIEYIAGMDRGQPHGKIPTTPIIFSSVESSIMNMIIIRSLAPTRSARKYYC
jgi:hypothetical protein